MPGSHDGRVVPAPSTRGSVTLGTRAASGFRLLRPKASGGLAITRPPGVSMLPISAFRISALRLTWNDCLCRAVIQPGWKITRGRLGRDFPDEGAQLAGGHAGVGFLPFRRGALDRSRRRSIPVTKRATKSLSYAPASAPRG